MTLVRRGNIWWYDFIYAGRRVQESAKTTSKTVARTAEQKLRRELEEGFNDTGKSGRVRTLADISTEYLTEYKLKHRSFTFAEYAIRHLCRQLGHKMVVHIDERTIVEYQMARLEERGSPKSINEEVGFLLRILNDRGERKLPSRGLP